MRKPVGSLAAILLAGAATICLSPRPAAAQDVKIRRNPIILHAERQGVSPPLRDIIRNMPPLPMEFHQIMEPGRMRPPITSSIPDPAEQRAKLPALPSLFELNFAGIGQGDYGYNDYFPVPDTNGAAGSTQYVQFINDDFAIFDKSTGALISGPTPAMDLWAGLGGTCAQPYQGDIVAKYDQMANRWVMTQFEFESEPYMLCVAVSQSDDATGAYYLYELSFGENFPDYPKISVWPDAYYATVNNFESNGDFAAEACALNRTAMLTGGAMSAQCFMNSDEASWLPSDLDGNTAPPTGEPAFFVDLYDSTDLHLFKFHVDFSNPSNSTFTGPTAITVASYSEACEGGACIPQPSPGDQLDSLGDRLMFRLAYRNFGTHESLLVSHSVTPSNGQVSAARWYEIRSPNGTPAIYQQGTFANSKAALWMPSIASDSAGNFAMGFSGSSSSIVPGIAVTGRLASDPLGNMRPLQIMKSGVGVEEYYRWGDYSDMEIDPVDDCTFWYTTEYVKTTNPTGNNWNTQIANFKIPGCG